MVAGMGLGRVGGCGGRRAAPPFNQPNPATTACLIQQLSTLCHPHQLPGGASKEGWEVLKSCKGTGGGGDVTDEKIKGLLVEWGEALGDIGCRWVGELEGSRWGYCAMLDDCPAASTCCPSRLLSAARSLALRPAAIKMLSPTVAASYYYPMQSLVAALCSLPWMWVTIAFSAPLLCFFKS
ncbi:hypothetical protein Acr_26g0002040 [Actinidia rufa]|uniref:Uncharacterized protein n=1 Tax=Actinidia rufa TaxID=165716 RepID=A0A7J0H2B7_9ERIC|nr:hypothetical protein Acr_26g0002040 [Actinidia rufa]